MIDVTYGNITSEEAGRLYNAVPSAFRSRDYPAGATEAWTADVVRALLVASGAWTVLETGCFMGHTSKVLADTLHLLGGGSLILCEIDPERAAALEKALPSHYNLAIRVRQEDALSVIRSLPDQWLGFAFVDDTHTKEHVRAEIELLISRMVPGGIIALHDVWGVCDLQSVVAEFGGYSLNLPRCGPAGGLGILQVGGADLG